MCFLNSDAVEWMTEYLRACSPEESTVTEEISISQLNMLVDAGYVSHVCNDHMFESGGSRTLYFRFHNDIIDADKRSIERRKDLLGELYGGVSTVVSEETAVLKMKVDRLTANVEKYQHLVDDAHGRILVLEEAISALTFALTSVVYSFAIQGLYKSFITNEERSYLNVASIAFNFAVLFVGTFCFFSRGLGRAYDSIVENVFTLVRLVRLGDDVEDAFMVDISDESTECSIRDDAISIQSATGATGLRESLFDKMRKRLSQPILPGPGAQVPIRARDFRSLPNAGRWPHRPVFVCANSDAQPDLHIPNYGQGHLPLGVPFEFSSDLFEGKCLIRLRDVPSDDVESDERYFLGRSRKFQAIVQGRFKERLRVSDVLTGHEFAKPLKGLPPPWIVSAACNLIKRLSPGVKISIHQQEPRALAILAATSQLLSGDAPDNEPDIRSIIDEDTSLFGGVFKNSDVSSSRRKRHLASPERSAHYYFDTESIYTFDFYQNILDCESYSLDLGFTKIGIGSILDGQPIQVLAKTRNGRYLWSFQIWHEKLLPKEVRHREREKAD